MLVLHPWDIPLLFLFVVVAIAWIGRIPQMYETSFGPVLNSLCVVLVVMFAFAAWKNFLTPDPIMGCAFILMLLVMVGCLIVRGRRYRQYFHHQQGEER